MNRMLSFLRERSSAIAGVLLLVLLVGLAVFLYFRTRVLEVPPPEPSAEPAVTSILNQPNNPIQKYPGADKRSFLYKLEGSFVGTIAQDQFREDKAWVGKFVLRGDSLKREIPLLIGIPEDTVLFGIFEGTLSGDSTWKIRGMADVAIELKPGELVLIQSEQKLPPDLAVVPDYFRSNQQVLDTLAGEFNTKEFGYTIPSDYTLIVTGIGVAR